MKNIITDLLSDLRHGDIGDKLLALLMLSIIAFVAVIIGCGIFTASDSWFIKDQPGMARVTGRQHTDEWYQTIYHSDGNGGGWTQVIYHPERWDFTMEQEGLSDSIGVTEFQFNTVPTGYEAPVQYRKGRFSDWLYITSADFTTRELEN